MAASISSSNGLYRTRTHFSVELHPSTVANVQDGVKEQLNTNLLRYVDEFGGVMLSYSNVEILTKKPVIHPYFPYFHLDVRADVLVFKPVPGMVLVGRVNHLGEDYISALVLGVFNVTIPSRSVMPELHFLREEEQWIHTKQPQHQIAEYSYVVFRVEEVRDHGGFFQIIGAMRDPATGAADFLYPGVTLPEPPVPDWAVDEDTQHADKGCVGARGEAAAGAAKTIANGGGKEDAATAAVANGVASKKSKGHKRQREAEEQEAKGKRRKKTRDGASTDELIPEPAAAATPAAPATIPTAAASTPAPGAQGDAVLTTKDGKKNGERSGKKDRDKSEKKKDRDKSGKKDKEKSDRKDKEKSEKKKKDKGGEGKVDQAGGGPAAAAATPAAAALQASTPAPDAAAATTATGAIGHRREGIHTDVGKRPLSDAQDNGEAGAAAGEWPQKRSVSDGGKEAGDGGGEKKKKKHKDKEGKGTGKKDKSEKREGKKEREKDRDG